MGSVLIVKEMFYMINYFFFFLFKKKYLYIKCIFYDCILSFKNIFVIIVNECVIVIVVDRVF